MPASELQWVLEAGWGPLLLLALGGDVAELDADLRQTLNIADQTARLLHAGRVDCINEVIDVCHALRVEAILLKGISVSEQVYPEAHLRPMADIDLIVPPHQAVAVEAALLERAYILDEDFPRDAGLHHGAPLYQGEYRVWVEIHTQLFSARDPLCSGSLFHPPRIFSSAVSSLCGVRPVKRLSDEYQLAYIASSWMRDITLSGIAPGFLNSLMDAVYLLKETGEALDWNSMFEWLDNEMAVASLYVTLSYMVRQGIGQVPNEVIRRLASLQKLVGPLQLRAIHGMLDKYLLGGRVWARLLPPPVPGRYSLRNQIRKRFWTLPGVRSERH